MRFDKIFVVLSSVSSVAALRIRDTLLTSNDNSTVPEPKRYIIEFTPVRQYRLGSVAEKDI